MPSNAASVMPEIDQVRAFGPTHRAMALFDHTAAALASGATAYPTLPAGTACKRHPLISPKVGSEVGETARYGSDVTEK